MRKETIVRVYKVTEYCDVKVIVDTDIGTNPMDNALNQAKAGTLEFTPSPYPFLAVLPNLR